MSTSDMVKQLRDIVFSWRGGANVVVDLDICKTLLLAACELEEKESAIREEQAKRNADCRFLEEICTAALNDLKSITKKHMLCDCCKYIREDGKCDSPRENEQNCWVWRGVCDENSGGCNV